MKTRELFEAVLQNAGSSIDNLDDKIITDLKDAPVVQFQQNELRLCLTYSWCSALHYYTKSNA